MHCQHIRNSAQNKARKHAINHLQHFIFQINISLQNSHSACFLQILIKTKHSNNLSCQQSLDVNLMTLRNDGAILSTKFDFTIWSRLTTSQSSGFLPTLVHKDVKNRKTKRSQINDGCEITSRSNSDILILKKTYHCNKHFWKPPQDPRYL